MVVLFVMVLVMLDMFHRNDARMFKSFEKLIKKIKRNDFTNIHSSLRRPSKDQRQQSMVVAA